MGQETFKEASLTYKIQYIIKFLGCQIKEMEEISRQHNSMLREFQPAETDYSDFDAKKMNIKLKSPPKGRFGAPAPNEEEKNIGIPNEEFWLKESKETSKTRMVDIPLILLNNKEMTLLQKYRFQPSQEFLFKLGDKIDNPSLLILQRHLETIITQNIVYILYIIYIYRIRIKRNSMRHSLNYQTPYKILFSILFGKLKENPMVYLS